MGAGGGGDTPAEGISWDRASKFCQNLNDRDEGPPTPAFRAASSDPWKHAMKCLPPGSGAPLAIPQKRLA